MTSDQTPKIKPPFIAAYVIFQCILYFCEKANSCLNPFCLTSGKAGLFEDLWHLYFLIIIFLLFMLYI